MLRLEAVSKRYGKGLWVIHDVDLEIPFGEVVAMTGANGSGKSTLLRLLVGVSRPTSGTVSGRPAVIGYVPDRFPAHARLSAMEYLIAQGRIRGLNTKTASVKAEQLLDRLGLTGGMHSALRTLSKGNAQKVALAQALLVQPQLLVLDEPWSGLDASVHGTVSDIITEVTGAGGSVVFTDHHESIVQAHASQVYLISSGRVIRRGALTGGSRHVADVVLTSLGGPHRARDVNWYAADGVLEVTNREKAITIRVDRDHSDALLLTALQNGWSVKELAPVVESANDTVTRHAR